MWKDISDLEARKRTESGVYTRNYLTLWFGHGKTPKDASYAYVLLPNRSAAETKAYAENPNMEIVKHTTRVHAVRERKLGLLGANFWTPGPNKADIITCKGEASVMLGKEPGGEFIVAVADPTHRGQVVELEIGRTAGKAISKDARIKVIQLKPTIKLNVNVKGQRGRSLSVRFAADKE
jgi:hyaluronate lyase